MSKQATVPSDKARYSGAVWAKRIVFYVGGLLILALAVSISIRSDLGVSPVSSVPLVLGRVLGIEVGNMTIIVFSVYVLLQILLLRKRFQWLQLLQVPCAVLFGKFVTLTGIWVRTWQPGSYAERLAMVALSCVLIGTGLKLYLVADIVPQAADGLVVTISKKFNFKLANVKNCFDLADVTLSVTISLLVTGAIFGVREGTVITALGVGRILWLLNKLDGGRLHMFLFGEAKE